MALLLSMLHILSGIDMVTVPCLFHSPTCVCGQSSSTHVWEKEISPSNPAHHDGH